jgi:NAD(P)-dependent dehydrogenase (short-subunit alcohol dehydrogenase family)
MQTGLAGKTILITGAASGIGRATAVAFAREGAQVAMIDHDPVELAATADMVREAGSNAIMAFTQVSVKRLSNSHPASTS